VYIFKGLPNSYGNVWASFFHRGPQQQLKYEIPCFQRGAQIQLQYVSTLISKGPQTETLMCKFYAFKGALNSNSNVWVRTFQRDQQLQRVHTMLSTEPHYNLQCANEENLQTHFYN